MAAMDVGWISERDPAGFAPVLFVGIIVFGRKPVIHEGKLRRLIESWHRFFVYLCVIS